MQTFQKRAAAGARFLDRKSPGWEKKVNPGILNLEHPRNCVLGQVYGVYHWGLTRMELEYRRALRLGFTVEDFGDFRPLTQAWKKLLVARLRRPQSGNGKVKTVR